MGHYTSNLRDIEFTLFEVLGRGDVLGSGPYEDLDADTAREMLKEVSRLSEHELAESFADADRNPPVYDPSTQAVTMPESFARSFAAYRVSGFWNIDLPAELDGTVAPPSLRWAVNEMLLGANPALAMFAASYSFAKLLHHLGTPEQQKLARLIVERGWHCTMVLTEPDAGSDVGAGRTKAVQNEDGTWTLTGVKRFITSAESDLVDNVVHFVLARPEGAGPGTKGLSLFILPKYHVDLETGELGERNGVYVTNVEKKMGLKVSPTCELTFGGEAPAVGTLLGDVHDGIAQMFHVIENARMMVGTKAIATLSSGYLNALGYAKERVQGADLTQMSDKTAPRVTITHHPDVRRSLMLQKAYAEGLRALVLYTATQQDVVDQHVLTTGEETFEEGSAADVANRVNDLLLPIVKGLGSERAWVLLGTESLQTYGGSGFLQDYPVEQYVRDAKIDTLYEGTTAIQGMDFFFRKIVRDKGQALTYLATQMQEFAKDLGAHGGRIDRERELLGQGVEDVQGILGYMVGELMKSDPRQGGDLPNIYKVGQNTTRLLLGAGDLVVGWLLLRQAAVALDALEAGAEGKDRDFYEGKVAAARFYARQVLPRLSAERAMAEATDNDLMDVPESAF
ncbi:acyl-CoA dehydrogenase [Phycicoccus endophyticus]|uniref:Broad-specificity linear acyl-CoA dehydrogenase FadE5 n=1 Tax=Phycicoccus endophyticus TaxID=1690220 RepID=A0A7G9R1F8_9MICO|nr:acyl-CoA dehydrogenase [Phycicoccus endophyticus]NHI18780.1 acyl-CoA dehydrogenase [Phycicoccus endophyticus]QNN49433.1 acyl-CoA dehydrogenase [Phycicoccus endophyticus]GGL36600.1 acyl-CoA dehydrogenase [Phycicoccus endophyticus]